ncbi:nicotinate-nucleotide--dimethylbenzimidazole phosphoribosyltransferase [Pikeienuella piscinae]|uniref:Nicotinate-nucleotide--dimethylbenzimidazole phosphoribosyltransferase n=1 Tax=Pikeienuella piscinae TaxID=2748098 RepID=A0A7M3T5U3_9RHOB|nr:nicotinate-nucleotide--dimethylbenzimidazole phosphoribosyltransferase [Pikeienuella piscinae]QIE57374.1 nicotinate-nucleotide--dimethylbenzimidazole phosphoribosyltransferase [Pikeienuella piscinae]
MLEEFTIPAVSEALRARVLAAIDAKTKPPGSLGRIETLALQLALAQGRAAPDASAALLLCAADHGLVAEGVSAWPSEVTLQMVLNFMAGGAAANVFARSVGASIRILDCGIASAPPDHPALSRAGIRAGARNALRQDALTADEVAAALDFGARAAVAEVEKGAGIVALGEMGIGNTSSGALLAHAVAGLPLDGLTGAGAGLDEAGVARKLKVLRAVAARRPGRLSPFDALRAFGGLEIAAMAGALIGASSARAAVLVDGYIATAAALVALEARPEAAAHVIFAHRSAEAGHDLMLDRLGAAPLLDLGLRLGEGSGALLALPLLKAAAAMLAEMATFESAGISGKEG